MSSKKDKKRASQQMPAKDPVNKASKGNAKKRYLIYLLLVFVAGIIGVVIALIKFYGKDTIKRNASVAIEFMYDGAAQNLTPNGEQFSINGLTSERIITKALENAGVSDRYSYSDIVSNLKVNASYPSDVIEKIKDYSSLYNFSESRSISINDYYPTLYQLQLFDNFDTSVSDSTLKTIVREIADEYKKNFINEYIYTYDVDGIDNLLPLSDYDYSQRVKIIKLRLSTLEKYSEMMMEKNIGFMHHGMSFSDFSIKCRQLDNDSLSNIEAAVMTDVLTTSVNRLKNQYEYEIKLLENELEYKNKNLDEINQLIDSYQMDSKLYISSGDSLVVVESNSKDTYQELVDEKREISARIVDISSEIDKYKLYLTNLKMAAYSSNSKNDAVESRLLTVYETLSELESSFKEMMEAYNLTVISDSDISIGGEVYQNAKILSGSFAIMAVKCAAPLCILMLIAISLSALISEIKKVRK